MHLTQGLKRAMQINGNGIATICAERQRSWRECGTRVARMAGALHGLGIDRGERGAILALNSDRYYELYYAMPWAGAVFVPVNIRLAPPEMAYWLNDSTSKALFVDDAFAGVVAELRASCPSLEHVVYIGDGTTPEAMLNYEELLAAADPAEDMVSGYDDLAGLFYTGGTTGRSKGVMLSHRNLVANAMNCVPSMNFRPDMRWLFAGPMFHIAAAPPLNGVTMAAGTNVFIPAFAPEAFLACVQEHGITDTLLVPTMVNMTVNYPDVASYDISSLKHIIYGASPMPEAVIRKAVELMPGCDFTHAYGQTECAPLVTLNGPQAHRGDGLERGLFKSCGQAVLGVEVQVVDEDGMEVPTGTVGELRVRGPNVMRGYWNLPEQTAAALKDGWMHSGDGAYMDEDGYVYIVDRVKDMIISGAENIYSAEVENAIYQHPAVVECAVIGLPDEKWGEAVHAIVRLREGGSAGAEDIIEHCRSLIAGFKCPRSVEFRDQPMPLSGAGKILKTVLREPYWKDQEKAVH